MREQKTNTGLRVYERQQSRADDRRQAVEVYAAKQALELVVCATELTGDLWGYERPEERLYQVQSTRKENAAPGTQMIGHWSKGEHSFHGDGLLLKTSSNGVEASVNGESAKLVIYDLEERDLRFRDLIIAKKLPGKHVSLVGCGSVGSRLARELVRYGIRLTVVDPDILEIHNLLRWGFSDSPEAMVGRKKVFVIKEMCARIVPEAQVRAEPRDFCLDIPYFDKLFREDPPSLVIASTDTADSLRDCNSLCLQHGLPALYVGLSDGAESGQIFFASGKPEDPCLGCIMEEEFTAVSLRRTNDNYMAEESQGQHAVPALSTDIGIISAITAKVVLAFLSGADLRQYFKNFDNTGEVMWFSTIPDTWIMEDFAQKVVAKVLKNPDCLACGTGRIQTDMEKRDEKQ